MYNKLGEKKGHGEPWLGKSTSTSHNEFAEGCSKSNSISRLEHFYSLVSYVTTKRKKIKSNQVSNFEFSGFFRVFFFFPLIIKYPHPKSQQTPRVSKVLEVVENLSYSFIPLQKILQKGVDHPVENPRKRIQNIKLAPNASNKFYWRMRREIPFCRVPVLLHECI